MRQRKNNWQYFSSVDIDSAGRKGGAGKKELTFKLIRFIIFQYRFFVIKKSDCAF
jgi:hypothetical protein